MMLVASQNLGGKISFVWGTALTTTVPAPSCNPDYHFQDLIKIKKTSTTQTATITTNTKGRAKVELPSYGSIEYSLIIT